MTRIKIDTGDDLCWCGLPRQVVDDHECALCARHCAIQRRRKGQSVYMDPRPPRRLF